VYSAVLQGGHIAEDELSEKRVCNRLLGFEIFMMWILLVHSSSTILISRSYKSLYTSSSLQVSSTRNI